MGSATPSMSGSGKTPSRWWMVDGGGVPRLFRGVGGTSSGATGASYDDGSGEAQKLKTRAQRR